jgi:hypothetical protein
MSYLQNRLSQTSDDTVHTVVVRSLADVLLHSLSRDVRVHFQYPCAVVCRDNTVVMDREFCVNEECVVKFKRTSASPFELFGYADIFANQTILMCD